MNQELLQLTEEKQRRLTELMAGNSAGDLTDAEREELRRLVQETEKVALENAKRLAAWAKPGPPSVSG